MYFFCCWSVVENEDRSYALQGAYRGMGRILPIVGGASCPAVCCSVPLVTGRTVPLVLIYLTIHRGFIGTGGRWKWCLAAMNRLHILVATKK